MDRSIRDDEAAIPSSAAKTPLLLYAAISPTTTVPTLGMVSLGQVRIFAITILE